MSTYAAPVQDLIDELGRLPGVGPKSAQRIAFYPLKAPAADAARLSRAITEAKDKVTFCTRCFNIAEGGECSHGHSTPDATPACICVVEESRDSSSVEKTGEFHGRYHVLQGVISPIEGVAPISSGCRELLARLDDEGVTEIILCTNPNLEGEATAMYLSRLIQPLGAKRYPHRQWAGPVGGDLGVRGRADAGLGPGRPARGRRRLMPTRSGRSRTLQALDGADAG